jgi:1-acyl-sn-glycerol-3-phosphate acyltransferase
MPAAWQGLRSFGSVLLIGAWWAVCGVVLRLYVVPASWIRPGRRLALVTDYMRLVCRGIIRILGWGGARFSRRGSIDTSSPVVVVMNHQSLVDIVQLTLMAAPYVPAFVTRSRYSRFVPLVSQSLRMMGAPIVDPRRDPKGSVRRLMAAARGLQHGLAIFPEGHRSLDGQVRPFRKAGLLAVLEARRIPVVLVATDGLWRGRRLADALFRVHLMNGRTEVIGTFVPPASRDELPAFVESLRARIVERVEDMRREGDGA